MKISELRQKTASDLQVHLLSLQKAHFILRMQKARQQLVNYAQLGDSRRAVARVKTVLSEKQHATK